VQTTIKGELVIDHKRGVIYFHCDAFGMAQHRVMTALRICGLPVPIPELNERMLDIIAYEAQVDWHGTRRGIKGADYEQDRKENS
jgi:hypothetical protein